MSVPSLAPSIMKRPWLMKWMKPLSQWYFDNAGYRKLGLRYAATETRRRHGMEGESAEDGRGYVREYMANALAATGPMT